MDYLVITRSLTFGITIEWQGSTYIAVPYLGNICEGVHTSLWLGISGLHATAN